MAKSIYRPDPDRDPVGPFLHYLMAECGVSPHTLAAYRSDLMGFLRWRKAHAPGPLARLEIGVLSGYVSELALAGLAPSSICRHLASLSTFFRFLVFEEKLSDNVAKLLVAPAVWDRLPTVLGPAAVERLLSVPKADTRLGRRDRAARSRLCTQLDAGPRRWSICDQRISTLKGDWHVASARATRNGGSRWERGRSRRSRPTWRRIDRSWFPGTPKRPRYWYPSPDGRCPGSGCGQSSSSTPGPPG